MISHFVYSELAGKLTTQSYANALDADRIKNRARTSEKRMPFKFELVVVMTMSPLIIYFINHPVYELPLF